MAEQKRDELQRQLSSEQPLTGGSVVIAAPAVPPTRAAPSARRRARLDELLLRYTDKHPDVIEARRALEDLRKRQAVENAAIRRGDARPRSPTAAWRRTRSTRTSACS